MTEDEKIEAWMARNRLNRAIRFLENKIQNAEKRGHASVMIPLAEAHTLVADLSRG